MGVHVEVVGNETDNEQLDGEDQVNAVDHHELINDILAKVARGDQEEAANIHEADGARLLLAMLPDKLTKVDINGDIEMDRVIVDAQTEQVSTEVGLDKVVQLETMPPVPHELDEVDSKPRELLEELSDERVGVQVDEVRGKVLVEEDLANAVDHQVLIEDNEEAASIGEADGSEPLLALLCEVPK
eukprot:191329-Amphidinium_carterae.1